RGLKQELLVLKGTEVSNLGNLQDLVRHVASEMGGGAYRERVALSGTIRCETPLEAPLSKQKCVYYKTQITEKYKALRTVKDSKGNRSKEWKTGRETLSRDETQTPFALDDPSGQVVIQPHDFSIEGIEVVEKFEPALPAASQDSGVHTIGDRIGLRFTPRRDSGYRTLGYHYREEILPLGTAIYVLGELTDEGRQLMVRSPSAPPSGIITHRSQEAIVGHKEKRLRKAKLVSTGFFVASFGVLVYGLYHVLSA
ncbi:MAG: GIDE domain-containing protein, partial [Elainellaceae cyanobacterium]